MNILGNKTFETIVSSFTKTVKELEELVENNKIKTIKNLENIFSLEEKNANMVEESEKASSVISKINNLLK